jgi:predicted metal-binding membrane protein
VLALAVSVIAWIVLWVAATADGGGGLYGSSMSVGTTLGSLLVFMAAWEIMAIAMMLPSSVGFLAFFRVVSAGAPLAGLRRTAVCVGYGLLWADAGGLAALMSETVSRVGSADVWLAHHAHGLAGGMLVLAGGFQFTTLKRRCLSVCSHPGSFVMRRYRRGVGEAFALGLRFGASCVGCCWALMALMAVLGGGSLYLMVLLAVVMFAERTLGWEERFVKLVGLACVVLGVLLAAYPDAVPALAQNAHQWIEMQSAPMHMQMPLPFDGGRVLCRG